MGENGVMFLGEQRLDWPYRDLQRNVDAWVWNMHVYEDNPIYDSLMFSLGEGLHTAGYNVGLVMQGTNTMLGNISAAVDKGRKPLVVGIAYPWTTKKSRLAWSKAKKLGAYMVIYQTEPLALADLGRWHGQYFPDEIWDYARTNIRAYPEKIQHKYRYVPPGYVKQLDYGVASVSKPRVADSIGFLGNWDTRSQQFADKFHDAFHGKLVDNNRCFSVEESRQWMATQPIQVTVHKSETCCGGFNCCPVEAFRLAQLLANGVCVISAPAFREDEAEWEGIVTFADISGMNERFEHLAHNLDECAEKASKFRQRFEPYAILKRSGLFDTWKP